jgi:hypothetical protein
LEEGVGGTMKGMKNLPLIIGIALPIVFIAVIAAVLYVPSLFVNPKHDFLYTLPDSNYYYYGSYENEYVVKNGALTVSPLPLRGDEKILATLPDLYLYDVETDTSKQIDREEAQMLKLSPGPSSPDGYLVEYRYSNSGIFELFGGGGNDNGYVIQKEGAAKHLSGLGNANGWSGNFSFVAWIID